MTPTRRPRVAVTRTVAYDEPDTLTLAEYRRLRKTELDDDHQAELDNDATP